MVSFQKKQILERHSLRNLVCFCSRGKAMASQELSIRI